jgi:hypothetical protein
VAIFPIATGIFAATFFATLAPLSPGRSNHRVIASLPKFFALVAIGILISRAASAQQERATPPPNEPLKKPSELIQQQPPMNVSARLLETVTPENSAVRVSLSKQRAYLMLGDEIVIDSPISSGKRAGMTPTGTFKVLEKDKSHHSNMYGDFKDSSGRTVRAGVSTRIDSAPSGTHFVGAEMKWFMRLTDGGVGMHIGILPGYPASHGCIRMPGKAAELFYSHVKVGTPVEVAE